MYKVGDMIRIKELDTIIHEWGSVQSTVHGWNDNMNKYVGRRYKIAHVHANGMQGISLINNDENNWSYCYKSVLPDYTLIDGKILTISSPDISYILGHPEIKIEFGFDYFILSPKQITFNNTIDEITVSKFFERTRQCTIV